MPRTGDIIIVAEQKKWAIGTLTRIFAPEDEKFSWKHLRNTFNTNYPTHVCQVGMINGKYVIKDTKEKGIKITPIDFYNKPENHQKIIAVYRPSEYDSEQVRDNFNKRMLEDLKKKENQVYDYPGIIADYTPKFLKVMFPFLLVPKNKELIQYCSERVRDDWTKDGGNPPKEKAFSPCDLDVFCKINKILDVIKEYVSTQPLNRRTNHGNA